LIKKIFVLAAIGITEKDDTKVLDDAKI